MFTMIFFNPVIGYVGRHMSNFFSLGQISLIFYLHKKCEVQIKTVSKKQNWGG